MVGGNRITLHDRSAIEDTVPLQVFGDSFGLGNLVIPTVVPGLIVTFGTYVGVLMALQSFFDTSSWERALADDGD